MDIGYRLSVIGLGVIQEYIVVLPLHAFNGFQEMLGIIFIIKDVLTIDFPHHDVIHSACAIFSRPYCHYIIQ
jgi:hypothetical protein